MMEYIKKNKAVIVIRDLVKCFGNHRVLDGFNMELYEGETLVMMGKSGSGKSVMIKCLIGLESHDAGSITIMDKNLDTMDEDTLNDIRTEVGFLFQGSALYDSMTVRENLEFPLRRIKKKLTEKEIADKVNEVLENVGLADALNKMPSQLSGGMRKRISLARTIVVDPMIILYDEPTTGLDPVTSDEISSLINEVQKKYKTSSIIITHDIKCALSTANRIIMLEDGEVYKEGKVEEFESSTDPLIKSFFN